MFDKSTPFKQVCQLPLSLIVDFEHAQYFGPFIAIPQVLAGFIFLL